MRACGGDLCTRKVVNLMEERKTNAKRRGRSFKNFLRSVLLPVLSDYKKEPGSVASSIPEFPHFKKLEFSDKTAIESFTLKYPPYSDFNFTSMWSWDIEDNMKISRLNDNLVVKFTDYLTNELFFSFLGESKISETIRLLLDISEADGLQRKLKLVPEIIIQHVKPADNIVITEDLDNFDYLYSADKLATYDGNRLRSKRNLYNRFQRAYLSKCRVEILHPSDPQKRKEIHEVLSEWRRRKHEEINTNEFIAIDRALRITEINAMFFLGLFVDDTLEGFVINELLRDGYALLHFEKANKNFIGIYSYLMQENAKMLCARGIKIINYEQDLGISGLRLGKKAFKPINYLKKYIVTSKVV